METSDNLIVKRFGLRAYVSGRYEPKPLGSPQHLPRKTFKVVAPFQAPALPGSSAGLTLQQESTFCLSRIPTR